ncbi:hypothetical protein BDQ12DRAFT_723141 [Crucibulum laeve]|uniref:Uncharacterized protein n=1 Tax=Crucibulum laeve TaxID=68775 RepID=A0A5C3M032_9AGAR|nr:hypothetical protein BDQ12DRAFT_723141 [Crucibulum laeve]
MSLGNFLSWIKRTTTRVVNTIRRVPTRYWVRAAIITAGVGILVYPVGILALNAFGFSAASVVASSIAASIQSNFYGAFTMGLFSFFQSAAATAIGASALWLQFAVGGAIIAFGVRVFGGDDDEEDCIPLYNKSRGDW